jgi:signal transduction histidine kinase
MILDTATLGVAFVLLSAVLGGLLLVAWVMDRERSLAWWGSAFCLAALGMSLVSLGQSNPNGTVLFIANALVIGAYSIQHAGCRIFTHRPLSPLIGLAGLAGWIVAWPFVRDSFEARFLLMSLVISGYSSASAWELWRMSRVRLRSQVLASTLLAANAVVHILRGSFLAVEHLVPWTDAFTERWSAEVGLSLLLYVPVLAFVFLWMSKERIEQSYEGAVEELAEARVTAEKASSAKTEFLASMSHEIRTPLNGVIGSAELLMQSGTLTPEQHQHAERIRKSGAALLTVVNDVLDFSKIEAGAIELDPQPFWPKALVEECVSIVDDAARRKTLSIRVDTGDRLPERVVGDEPRLRQVLLNLINNAVKFTPRGGITVALQHESASATHERLHFAVSDTGIGIPDSKLSRLFERFSQVDGSTTRQHGGTGLGLAISKRLIELMGGTIGVTSEAGRGSTFWFTVVLPRARDSETTVLDHAPVPPQRRRGARILLAEDVAINQEIAAAILQRGGYEVDVVGDGSEAVKAVQERDYDLVLMDVQMPVMDGIDATHHIRALNGPVRDIPIIAMTANVYAEQVSTFKASGMNDHVGKPFRAEELYSAIDRALDG